MAALHHRRVDDGAPVDGVAVARGDDREVRRAIHGHFRARRQPFPRSSDQFDRAFHAPMKTRNSLLYIWRKFSAKVVDKRHLALGCGGEGTLEKDFVKF